MAPGEGDHDTCSHLGAGENKMPAFLWEKNQFARKGVKAMNINQSPTKGPIIANEGQPGGTTTAPSCCPDNAETRCGTVV